MSQIAQSNHSAAVLARVSAGAVARVRAAEVAHAIAGAPRVHSSVKPGSHKLHKHCQPRVARDTNELSTDATVALLAAETTAPGQY